MTHNNKSYRINNTIVTSSIYRIATVVVVITHPTEKQSKYWIECDDLNQARMFFQFTIEFFQFHQIRLEWSIKRTWFRKSKTDLRKHWQLRRCCVDRAALFLVIYSLPWCLFSIQTWFSLVSRLSLSSLNRLTLVTKAEPLLKRVEIKPEWPAYVNHFRQPVFLSTYIRYHQII